MKKSITKTVLLIMIAMVSIMMAAQIAKAGVKNSKHDLSSGSTGAVYKTTDGTDQVCVFCHTPHFASASAAPLWNRNVTSSTYTMYTSTTSATLDMTIGASPQGVSAACLSCHDGSVAFDSLINKPGSGKGAPSGWTWTPGNTMTTGTSPAGMLGTDMTNDHPISITYDTAKDSAFAPITSGKVAGILPLYGSGKNQLECASCHNVHEPGTAGSTAPFLRATNAASALCLTCHVK
jgi:hypothetical protein